MPAKKGKKKGKGKKKKKMVGNETPEAVMKRLLKTYERNCLASDTLMCPSLRSTLREGMDNDALVTKLILEPVGVMSMEDPVVALEPLLTSLRQERYTHATSLYIWDVPLKHTDISTLALLLEKGVYTMTTIELMDCLVAPEPLGRLAMSFNACPSLSTVNFDYNEFGDAGVSRLSVGLTGNRNIISLSLCYCGLEVPSGKVLGHIVATTAVRELFVDGNDLECEGAVEIIKSCVKMAEEEAYQREEEERIKAEEEAKAAMEKQNQKRTVVSEAESEPDKPGSGKKKKKKKKGKKKKGPPPPPLVGPWLYKLHIADNGIDHHCQGGNLAPLLCMRLFRKLLSMSKCLEELDLEDNLIGDLGGKEVMEGLEDRKEAKLGGVKMRTTHRMSDDIFNTILKLGTGLKKKKKKRGKKKKK